MTYISITNFEIRRVPVPNNSEIIYLQFFINQSNFLSFPFDLKNIQFEIIEKFNKVLLGKEVVINLSMGQPTGDESKILQIKKEYTLFNIIKKDGAFNQETYLIMENNSIFRNAIRQFLLVGTD
jgi:hypothetical protein